MRSVFVIILTLTFVLSVASPVAAQDTKTTSENDIRSFISKKWPGLYQRLEKNKVLMPVVTRAPKLNADNVQGLVKSAMTKFEQREYQYQQFIDKLKSRRDKLAADGKDVSKIDVLIAELEARQEELKDLIQSEKEWMSTLDPADMSAAKKAEAKVHVESVKKLLKEHQVEVEKVVKALKEQTVQTKSTKPNVLPPGARIKMIPTGYIVPPPRYKDGAN